MLVDKNTREYEESRVPTVAESPAGSGTRRQTDRRNHRFTREFREELANKILRSEDESYKRAFRFRKQRYNAYVLEEGSAEWIVYIRYAPCHNETEQERVERYREYKKRLLMGRPVHMGGEVDRSSENMGVYERVPKV